MQSTYMFYLHNRSWFGQDMTFGDEGENLYLVIKIFTDVWLIVSVAYVAL